MYPHRHAFTESICRALSDRERTMSQEQLEQLAIRAAKGNNGGEWSTHYTEEQREYWREFVRDIARAIPPPRYQPHGHDFVG